jgi:outer membrane lipoprotein-sorting protein
VAWLSLARPYGDMCTRPAHSGLMTRILTSRGLRWAVPSLVAAGVAAAAITSTNGAAASDRPTLPAKTAAQLLASVQQADRASLSGTIVETANLGLPNMPTGDSGGGVSMQALLTGSHTMRIWYAGPNEQRLAVFAPMSERDVIHNGADLWTYTSTTNHVTHTTVRGTAPTARPGTSELTPQQAAEQALHAVDPSTSVSADSTARVAGRAAYQLDLTPRDSRSLIGSVRIAIDAATSTPLRVQVFAEGASAPAIQIGFTEISFNTPRPSVFHFVPPAGATVTQQQPEASHADLRDGSSHQPALRDGRGSVANSARVLGSGWTMVVKLQLKGQLTGSNAELLNRLSVAVPAGRLITTSVVSVLVTKGGYVFAGPVSGAAIEHVAATGHGL